MGQLHSSILDLMNDYVEFIYKSGFKDKCIAQKNQVLGVIFMQKYRSNYLWLIS